MSSGTFPWSKIYRKCFCSRGPVKDLLSGLGGNFPALRGRNGKKREVMEDRRGGFSPKRVLDLRSLKCDCPRNLWLATKPVFYWWCDEGRQICDQEVVSS